MFHFQWPWFILLLPLPYLVQRFWVIQQREIDTLPQLRFSATHRLQQAFTPTAFSQTKQPIWVEFLLWLVWIGLVFALMYPQLIDKQVEIIESGYDLMLAVDLSESMQEQDFSSPQGYRINRLEAVKQVMGPFIQRRVGDRLGLILFADQAYLQAPLTLDNEAVYTLLQKTVLGMAGKKTAIGDAIGLAVKKLRERPEESRVLILLTDGENTAGQLSPLKASQLAKQYRIRIYTIGVGTLDVFGRGFDERTLRKIADLTEGAYYSATDINALANVYAHIDKTLHKTEAESRVYLQRTPLYHWPLGIAMLALLALLLYRYFHTMFNLRRHSDKS